MPLDPDVAITAAMPSATFSGAPATMPRPNAGPPSSARCKASRSRSGSSASVGIRAVIRISDSVVPGERRPVGVALLEEGVPALDGLVGAVRQPGGFTGEHLLADQA